MSPNAVDHFVLTVVPPVSITTTALPGAQVGTAYGAQISATGGQPGYHFSVVGGALPAGLSLADNGTVSGIPTGPVGNYGVTIKVTDSASPAQSATKAIIVFVSKGISTLTVQPVLLTTTSTGVKATIGTVTATLTGGTLNWPIAGQTIVFKGLLQIPVCTGVTNANGTVVCTMSAASTAVAISATKVIATYAGNALWLPATGTAGLVGPG